MVNAYPRKRTTQTTLDTAKRPSWRKVRESYGDIEEKRYDARHMGEVYYREGTSGRIRWWVWDLGSLNRYTTGLTDSFMDGRRKADEVHRGMH